MISMCSSEWSMITLESLILQMKRLVYLIVGMAALFLSSCKENGEADPSMSYAVKITMSLADYSEHIYVQSPRIWVGDERVLVVDSAQEDVAVTSRPISPSAASSLFIYNMPLSKQENTLIGIYPHNAPIRIESECLKFNIPQEQDGTSVLDDKARAANVETMAKMIRLAGEFKPKKLVLHPSSEPISDSDRTRRLENAKESIGKLLPIAKEVGSQLCIENLPRTCLGRTSREIMYLIQDYPDVMVCFDSNHLLIEDHDQFFRNVGNRIGTIHASDYDKVDERHWIPGKGVINWPLFLTNLMHYDYDGVFMTEVKSGTAAEVMSAYKNVICATNN